MFRMFPIEKTEKIYHSIQEAFAPQPAILDEYASRAQKALIYQHQIPPEIGVLLQVLIAATNARTVLEIGTLWGCSAWWISQALLQQDGVLTTIEKHRKHYDFARRFFDEQRLENIDFVYGDALQELLRFQADQFDMVFLDADKKEYPLFLERLTPVLRSGGMLIVDNVIYSSNWKGETTADETDHPGIRATQAFNSALAHSDAFIALPLPIHSGLMLAVKK